MYIAGAVASIALLQGLLRDLSRAGDATRPAESAARELVDAAEALAPVFVEPAETPRGDLERILAASARLRVAFAGLDDAIPPGGTARSACDRIAELLPGVAPEAAWFDERSIDSWRLFAPSMAVRIAEEAEEVRVAVRAASSEELLGITRRLRTIIVVFALATLFALNVTIVLLLRTGEMIVRPVEALVHASRELAMERFDHRVEVDASGEFAELARSYNQLAEQLALNEAKKMETLQQLAVTLNHELNNAIGIIELQLSSLQRRAAGDHALADRLTQIRENLRRITATVASLKDVRRIVLTDYAPGLKMLDLEKSTLGVGEGEAGASGSVGGARG
jgi:signal transduction histidine kinase